MNNKRYSSGKNVVKSSFNLLGNILPILQEGVISVKIRKKGIYWEEEILHLIMLTGGSETKGYRLVRVKETQGL